MSPASFLATPAAQPAALSPQGAVVAARIAWTLLPATGIAILISASSCSLGLRIVRRLDIKSPQEELLLSVAVGMGAISLLVLVLGVAGVLTGPVAWTLMVLFLLASIRRLIRQLASCARTAAYHFRDISVLGALPFAAGAVLLAFNLMAAFAPPLDYDVLEYHLGAPAQYYEDSRIGHLDRNVYASFPSNVEMQYLLATVLRGDVLQGAYAGQLLNVFLGLLAAAAVGMLVARHVSPGAGGFAAATFYSAPLVFAVSQKPYVELGTTFFASMAIHYFLCARQEARQARRNLVFCLIAGIMTGLAAGCKYPVLLFLFLPAVLWLVIDNLRAGLRPMCRQIAAYALATLVLLSPWLIKNLAFTGNPMYPLLYGVFGGKSWDPEKETRWREAHAPPTAGWLALGSRARNFLAEDGLASPLLLVLLPLSIVGQKSPRPLRWVCLYGSLFLLVYFMGVSSMVGRFFVWPHPPPVVKAWLKASHFGLLGALGVLFFFGPPRKCHSLRLLGGYAALYFLLWFLLTHQMNRFLVPALPAIVAVSAAGTVAAPSSRWDAAIKSLYVALLAYCVAVSVFIHTSEISASRVAIGLEKEEDYLERLSAGSTYSAEALEYINTSLPANSLVLFVGEARTFYCRRPFLAATVFDTNPLHRILSDSYDQPNRRYKTSEVRQSLEALGVTHIYVNWPEVLRLQRNYEYSHRGKLRPGYSEHITPAVFWEMNRAFLEVVAAFGPGGETWEGRGELFPATFVIYRLVGETSAVGGAAPGNRG